jgi:hypothetical protein
VLEKEHSGREETLFRRAYSRLSIFGIALSLFCIGTPVAQAAETTCTEHITSVIAHVNGFIYFQSDQTCSVNWCQLNWTGTTLQNGYAALLSARALGSSVNLAWPNIATCTTQNATWASPDYVQINPS